MIMTHQFQLLFTECDYPRTFMIWIGLHGLLFLGLFSDFYKSKYTGGKPSKPSRQAMSNGGNNGACMPVLDDHKDSLANGGTCCKQNGVSSYATIYNKEYNSCYSSGTNNGYVANVTADSKKLA